MVRRNMMGGSRKKTLRKRKVGCHVTSRFCLQRRAQQTWIEYRLIGGQSKSQEPFLRWIRGMMYIQSRYSNVEVRSSILAAQQVPVE